MIGALLPLLVLPLGSGLALAEDEVQEPVSEESLSEDSAPAGPPADPPVAPPEWVDLGVPVDFSSAIETAFEAEAADPTGQGDLSELMGLAQDAVAPGLRLRGRFGLRPQLGLVGTRSGAGEDIGGLAGLALTHQWWSLKEVGAKLAGQSDLRAYGRFGGLSGGALQLDSAVGPWLGPVGVLLGGGLRADKLQSDSGMAQAPALVGGPTARLSLVLGPLSPWAALTPGWVLAGDRPGLPSVPWDEFDLRFGLVLHRQQVSWRLSGGWRATGAGNLWEAGVGIHLVPF